MIDSMYRLAKYRYECGNYVESASYLYFCQLVMCPTDKVRFHLSCGTLSGHDIVCRKKWELKNVAEIERRVGFSLPSSRKATQNIPSIFFSVQPRNAIT